MDSVETACKWKIPITFEQVTVNGIESTPRDFYELLI